MLIVLICISLQNVGDRHPCMDACETCSNKKKMLHLNPEHASHFAPHICIHWTIMNLVHLSKL